MSSYTWNSVHLLYGFIRMVGNPRAGISSIPLLAGFYLPLFASQRSRQELWLSWTTTSLLLYWISILSEEVFDHFWFFFKEFYLLYGKVTSPIFCLCFPAAVGSVKITYINCFEIGADVCYMTASNYNFNFQCLLWFSSRRMCITCFLK